MLAMFNVTHTMFRIWGPVADRADSHQPLASSSSLRLKKAVNAKTGLQFLLRHICCRVVPSVEHAVPEAHGVGKTR